MDDVAANGIQVLPISFSHPVQQNKLPFLHRDPFVRILISQALVEEIHLISKDPIFDAYLLNQPIRRIW
jgi:PIN domain nuclease of toxin-antitoxin system